MPPTKKGETAVIELTPSDVGRLEVGIISLSPFIHNRMAMKAMHELLFPSGGRKTAAAKAASLKHNPVEEFRSSPYLLDEEQPTALGVMASAFKGAMKTAAKDMTGVNGAQVGRLVWVEGVGIAKDLVPLWGDARLFMSVTRSADIKRTPDIRTRALSPVWGTVLTVRYVKPQLTETAVANLLSTAGLTAGVGDWRTEKGSGTFGQFELCEVDDPRLLEVQKFDRARQLAALDAAVTFNAETQELLEWFNEQLVTRGRAPATDEEEDDESDEGSTDS